MSSRRSYLRRIETAVIDDRNALSSVLEAVGFGWGQIMQLMLGGLTIATSGCAVVLVSSVSNDIGRAMEIANTSQALIPVSNFCGIALGSLVSGPKSDSIGRRPPILLGFIGVAIFQFLSGCVILKLWVMIPVMFLLGVSMGLGIPPFKVLCSEMVPAERRIHAGFIGDCMFVVEAVYAGYLIWVNDPSMKDLDWRWLLVVGAIPAAIAFLIAYFFLYESPFFLAMRHENDKAREVLDSLRILNGNPEVPTHYDPPLQTRTPSKETTLATHSNEIWDDLKIMFGRRLIYTTCVTCFTEFVINFEYYGSMYAFAQVLPALNMWLSPAVSLILSLLAEVPAYVLCIFAGMYMERKTAMILTITATAIIISLFAISASYMAGEKVSGWWEVLLQSSVFGFKAIIQITWAIVRLYIVEINPTRTRTKGIALAIGLGWSGSIICILSFELMKSTFGTLVIFWVIAGLNVANAALVFFLPYETKGKLLDDEDETEPFLSK